MCFENGCSSEGSMLRRWWVESWVDKWSLWKSSPASKSNGVNKFRRISIDGINPSEIILRHSTCIQEPTQFFNFWSNEGWCAGEFLFWENQSFANFTKPDDGYRGTNWKTFPWTSCHTWLANLGLHLGRWAPSPHFFWNQVFYYIIWLATIVVNWNVFADYLQVSHWYDSWSVQWPTQHLVEVLPFLPSSPTYSMKSIGESDWSHSI